MKNRRALPIIFIAVSSLIFTLGAYLLATKTTLHPQFFITACGEVLKNIQEHVHLNPDGVFASLILLVTAMGVSLALFQFVMFIVSSRRLHQFRTVKVPPNSLKKIINKHDLPHSSVSVVKNNNLTAYTIGLFKPRIIISTALITKLSQEQLEAVVLHELYHLRSRHVLWLLLSRLVSALFFFIPLVEYLAQQLRVEFELAADAFVVEEQKTRGHLCSSLALNIQYAGGVIPHFSNSPIVRRVNYLVGNKLPFERVGNTRLTVSLLSLGLMLGIAFAQPNQVVANLTFESGGVCSVEADCQTTECLGQEANDIHNFAPLNPASFLLSSSY